MHEKLSRIETDDAPQAIGPYSQAIVAAPGQALVFVSGQLPVDPHTGKLVDGDMRAMTNRVIDNLEAILKAGGSSLERVVRTDVFLTDLQADFASMNEAYAARFSGKVVPARQTVQVARLPMGAPVEISCIALCE